MTHTDLDIRERQALRQVEDLQRAPVPDPGPLYWSSFPGRVRRTLDSTPGARRWVPWSGMAAAAALFMAAWIGGRSLAPTALPAAADPALTVLDRWEAEHLDGALDLVLGDNTGADLTGDLQGMSREAKQALLESLRDELSRSTAPTTAGQDPA